jgi:hypothetical protein
VTCIDFPTPFERPSDASLGPAEGAETPASGCLYWHPEVRGKEFKQLRKQARIFNGGNKNQDRGTSREAAGRSPAEGRLETCAYRRPEMGATERASCLLFHKG